MESSILYSEVSLVCILILTLIANKIRNSLLIQAQRHLFYTVVVIMIAFHALDASWIFVNNQVSTFAINSNWILNIVYYILSGMLGFSWFFYSETVQNSRLVTDKRLRMISILPIILLVVMSLIAPKTGWMFYIDENNIYHRGPAYFIQLLCSYGYVVFTACNAFIKSFRSDEYQKKTELKTLGIFVVPTLIAGFLQVIYQGYPLLCVGNTFGILYVYITLQEQLISLDPLTKLNNRNQFYQYYSTKISHHAGTRDTYLLIMDVDYFKSINDQYGHIEGDRALKYIASVLLKVAKDKQYFISRFGGDEFIMICDLSPDESIQSVCETIHSEIRKIEVPYNLSVSIGYAQYSPEIKNQQQFISKADVELYKVKKNR